MRRRLLAVFAVAVASVVLPIGQPQIAKAASSSTDSAPATTASAGAYTPVTPYRLCDTRPPGGTVPTNQCNNDSTGAGSGPISQGASRVVTVDGWGPVPGSDVSAVVVNLTAVAPSRNTYLSVYPDGAGTGSATSNLNPDAGAVLANLVEVGVGADGKIDVYNNMGSTNVILDVEGYVDAGSTALYTPTTPARICDTRAAGPGIAPNRCDTHGLSPIGANQTLTFAVTGPGSPVPSTASAVVFNLTAISPTVSTVLTAFAGGISKPNASNLNVAAHVNLPNRVIVPVTCVGSTCTVSIWNSVGSVNIAVDVDGWYSASGAQFTALSTPARVCDTRYGTQACPKGIVAGGHVVNVDIAGVDGIPVDTGDAGSPVAIVANVTAVGATMNTYISVYPGPPSTNKPDVSDVNPAPGQTATNLVVVGVGSDGSINLYNNVGAINLIVDVVGYYATQSVEPPGATYSSTIGGPGHAAMYPSGMEIAPNGNIVIADTGNNQVAEYTRGRHGGLAGRLRGERRQRVGNVAVRAASRRRC